MSDTYEPMQSKEFRERYGGMQAKRIFDSVGKFGEMKFLAKLQIKDSSGEVVYEERHLIK